MEARACLSAIVAAVLLVATPHAVSAGSLRPLEEARYLVARDGEVVGEARARVRDLSCGSREHVFSSRVRSPRQKAGFRVVREVVRSRDGVLSSGEVRVEMGGEVSGLLVRRSGEAFELRSDDGGVRRLEPPPGAPVFVPLHAARRLCLGEERGEEQIVVLDPGAAALGRIGLVERRSDGGCVVDELGVRARYVWKNAALLPAEIHLDHLGVSYIQAGRQSPEAMQPAGEGGAGARARYQGRLAPGSVFRMEPRQALPGLRCEGGLGRVTEHGPICPTEDLPAAALPAQAGPAARELAAELPAQLGAQQRAAWLAARIAERLSGSLRGAGWWEASPEQALESGSGDCNEAAAVFMAVAPLLDLQARRRTGLVARPTSADGHLGELLPHAWVEIRVGASWLRVDPSRGEAPARGVYIDLGDGSGLAARSRTIGAVRSGMMLTVIDQSSPQANGED